jgi:hypothetical protein
MQYLGIDWADKKHDLCLVDAANGRQSKQVLAHTPQAISLTCAAGTRDN